MYLLIVFLPLFGFLCASLFGRFLGYRGSALLTTGCVSFTTFLSLIAFYEVGLCSSPCYIEFAPWIQSEMFDASWGFYFDSLTVVMLVVVTFVSSLVHLYSISYMSEDPHLPRFMSYLSLFTFFMLMLVTANNFIQLFLGWEGVGLASYLLINFWFTRLQANKSAIKAMIMNRIGDFGLALGILGIFSLFKSVHFATVFALVGEYANTSFSFCTFDFDTLTLLCFFLFIGSIGKSAQLGLHTWLPDAMEGPTPVSALIHAATMVTAGVFLLARCSSLFEHAPVALIGVTFIGAMTSFFAATTGVVQNDLKRVIAYSTCSQLGYMIFACGISHYSVGVFHLMNHAFFKALLFLSAGSVIHALSDEQDMRKMGGLARLLPFTYSMMVIGSLALIGFPFLTGFYSKDVILEVTYAKYTIHGNFAYWLGSLSALFTSYYSFRLLYLTFLAPTNAFKQSIKGVHDAPILMAIPLILLALGSIFVGYMAKDMMIGIGSPFWGNALFQMPSHALLIESEYIPQFIKMIPLLFSLLGASIASKINSGACRAESSVAFWPSAEKQSTSAHLAYSFKTSPIGLSLYTFLNKRWLFDKVYNDFIGYPALKMGYDITFKTIDKGVLELIGPSGIINILGSNANKAPKEREGVTPLSTPLRARSFLSSVNKFQSGALYHYAFVMLIGLTVFIALIGLWDFISFWIESRIFFLHLLTFIYICGLKTE